MAVTVEMRTQVSQLYVALFGRAPDSEGLAFWTQMLANGTSVEDVADTMYATDPARSYYPLWMTNQEIIASFYLNVLGRPADAEGLTYWTNKLNAAGATPGSVIQEMIDVVVNYTGTDPDGIKSAALFANKVEVAQYYGEHGGDVEGATAILVGVTDDPATVDEAIASLSAPVIGDTLFLTAAVDDITIATANTADTIKGLVDGDSTDGNQSTFTALDTIQGNGHTVLQLAVVDSGPAAPITTLNDIKTIDLVSGGFDATFNAADWHDIGNIQLNTGANGMSGWFSNLHTGVDLSVGAGLSGSLGASYTDAHGVWMFSSKGASVSFIDGGDITGASAGGPIGIYVSEWASAPAVDLTIGNIDMVGGGGDSVYVQVSNSQDVGGDITIGDVSMTGFRTIDFYVSNTDHTAMSPAVDTTIGDITLSVSDSGSISVSVSNWSDGVAGNTTVGNVSLTGGDNVTSEWFYLYQWGGAGAGNVTVGDVSLSAGVSATDVDTWIENYAGWMGGAAVAPIVQGAMTVGDINVDLGMNSTGSFSVSAMAYTNAAAIDVSVGDYTVGDLSVTLGQDAWWSGWFYNAAEVDGAGAAVLADTVIGNRSFDLAVDASLSYSFIASASSSGPAASVGDVTIGDLDVNLGINSSAWIEDSVYAYGTDDTKVTIGDVTVGDITVVADDGASFSYSLSITSYGDLGDVSFGDVSAVLGVSADVSFSYSISASDDVGNVSFGNFDLSAGQNADVTASISVSAWSGDVASVTVGDVSLSAGVSAWASFELSIEGETSVGAVTVGDVSISAVGFDASASFELDVENDGAGSLGNITVGDVDMTVNGDSAWGWFSVTASSAASGGDITVGDLTLSVGTLAKKTADLNVYIDNDFGDVVVGDINLTGTSVRAVGDVTMDYDANVTLISSAVGGSISIGTISVSGGDGVADNFQALGFLVATPGAGGAVSLGGVDYSGYGVAATLDVSGFAGNTSIVGSAFGDTITDNKGVNAITGGAGADTFTFLDTNVGKTLGAMDSLKDFNDAAGDKIDLTVAVNVGNYGESTYADFAAFAAGAAAADKAVWVGLVGSTGYAAVDYDTNGTVDYMIELVGLTSTGNIDVASFI